MLDRDGQLGYPLFKGKVCLKESRRRKGTRRRSQIRYSIVQDFESVGLVDDFELGQGKAVVFDGRMVAVFRTTDGWYAIDDLCPHMGASLAEGYLDGDSVSCPWHAWRFCIKDGSWEDNPQTKVDCFEVKIEGNEVLVRENKNPA